MLFPVDFPFSEKTRKSSLSLRTPEKPPEKIKNLTGKCPAALVIAVSGGFSVLRKDPKIEPQPADTGKTTGKYQKPDRKMPCSPRNCCFRWIFRSQKRPENRASACGHRKNHRKKSKT
ncbi:hypothetical protein QDX81_08765 [Pseudomonas sp. CW003PS]|nr:hypothetical protein QDX81_08765 [Pseudomonas sp. CW003PS]